MAPQSAFDLDLSLVLLSEGGKVDNRFDPGGRTAYGITQAVYDGWRDRHDLHRRDVFLITPDERRAIYLEQYAVPLRVDAMPAGLGYAVFDAGVMSGPVQSVKWLQRGLGVADDGHIGLVTLGTLRRVNDLDGLIDRVLDQRLGMMRHLPTWAHFGLGWSRRVAFVRDHAHRMGRPAAVTAVAAPRAIARTTATRARG